MSCHCGEVILADTENWKQPLCLEHYSELKSPDVPELLRKLSLSQFAEIQFTVGDFIDLKMANKVIDSQRKIIRRYATALFDLDVYTRNDQSCIRCVWVNNSVKRVIEENKLQW